MLTKYAVAVAVLLLACGVRAADVESSAMKSQGQRILATSSTVVVTSVLSTGTATVSTSCAVLVNATSACRKRRGVEEKPEILALDDDLVITPSEINP